MSLSWDTRAGWDRPTWDIDEVAQFLDTTPNNVRQMNVRKTFPPPEDRDSRPHRWSPATVYRHALQHRQQVSARVPRLFPRIPHPAPARFLNALTVAVPGSGPAYVVYRWMPGDLGGGTIALAYPIDNSQGTGTPAERAHGLYQALGDAGGVVAIPDTQEIRGYPSLRIVDGREPTEIFHETHADGVIQSSWHDLSYLLRVDIPWWPRPLRDERSMLAWTPKSTAVTLHPRTTQDDPAAISDLITDDTSEPVRQALEQSAARLARALAGGLETYVETPGFIYGARCSVDATSAFPPLWTWEQSAAVLHHHVPSPAAAAAALANMDPGPAATYTFAVSPHDAEDPMSLASQWMRRLKRYRGPLELGHHLVADHAGRLPVETFLRDPHNNDCWIALDATGTVHATVGTRVPATGVPDCAELLTSGAAFFRATDDTGKSTAWPVPHRDSGGFSSGYPGTGPRELARALTRLMTNRTATVEDGSDFDPNGRLWSVVSTQEPPLRLTLGARDSIMVAREDR